MANDLLIRSLNIDWNIIPPDSYLRKIESLKDRDEIVFNTPVTFFAGENGSGKSTLLEGIAVAAGFNPEGGTRNYAFSTYDSHSSLHEAIRLIRGVRRIRTGYFLRAESFYNVATKEEEYSRQKGGRPQHYHEKSHGESFLALARNHFSADGLYLLDEPENSLSAEKQLELKRFLFDSARFYGCQFIIASHSPFILSVPGAKVYDIDSERMDARRWTELKNVRTYFDFFKEHEADFD